jgi:hypothetical protein
MNKAWLVIAIALTMACAGASTPRAAKRGRRGDLPHPVTAP